MHLTNEQDQLLDAMIVSIITFLSKGNQRLTTDIIFKKTWKVIYRQLLSGESDNPETFNGISAKLHGPYQLNIREYLLLKIIKIFVKYNIKYSPILLTENNKFLNALKTSHEPAIFVSTHNGFAHNIKALMHLGRTVTTIGTQPDTNHALNRSSIPLDLNIINQDRYCLAYAKKSIANGELISTTVDFHNASGEPFQYISPALFAFSKKLDVALYFSKSEVLMDGSVKLSFELSPNTATPEETANQFISYCNDINAPKRSLIVKAFKS